MRQYIDYGGTKMKNNGLIKEGSVLLSEDHVCFGGMHLIYQLLVCPADLRHRFCICIKKDEESAQAPAGSDLARAMTCYRRIVEGAVTPCTLEEVLADLFSA